MSNPESRENMSPPKAPQIPERLERHGHIRIDNYYWLKERENPEVVKYLEAENDYAKAVMAHREKFEASMFQEIKGRIKQTDLSVPYKLDDYYYYTRFEEGCEYPLFCRKKGSLDSDEHLMLDVNVLAEGHEFFAVGGCVVSYGQDILAYAVDTQGRRIYTIHFKNLMTGETLADVIPGVTGNMAWANDNQTIFYAKQDPNTLRSYQVMRHILGSNVSHDQLVYEEQDETFSTYVMKSKSKQYVFIASHQTVSSEYRYLEANNPCGDFRIIAPREGDHEYDVDHIGESFYIRTNDKAKNFRLAMTPVANPGKNHWQEVIPHRDEVLLESFELFKDHLVVEERKEGLVHLRIIPWEGEGAHYLDFGEPTYLVTLGDNPEFDTALLRFEYTSMTTPLSVFDYNLVNREKTLLKQEEVLGGFEPSLYQTERVWAKAEDGVEVPVSIVYRKDLKRPGQNPLLLYGYGSYGASMDAAFSSPRLSLLDRGFVFAIAHIRGGEEMGRTWYEGGKLFKKKNTFSDFIACGEHLIRNGYGNPDMLFAMGGSAGGLLMGAVMNMRPNVFKGVVAQVPFVDVITTMLDPSIPLTTGEYDEWGNPNEKEQYNYILSYSPYDNVEPKDYPHLLVTTGLHDSQVQFWEPAKWVAKLRALKTNHTRILLKTNMDAGHSGVSGRFRKYTELAYIYTFLCDLADVA